MLHNAHKQLLGQFCVAQHQVVHSRLLCNLIAALHQLLRLQQMHTAIDTIADTAAYLLFDSRRNFMQVSISSVSVTASATTAYSRTVFLFIA